MNKTEKLSFRCTEDEKKLIEKNAQEMGVSISDYLAYRGSKKRHCVSNREKNLLVHLIEIQNKVNDVMNSCKNLDEKTKMTLEALVQEVSEWQ